jgi:hypothetical protein
MKKLNKLNTARSPNIKADSPEVKEVVDFAERLRYVLELKINKLRTIMQKSDNHLEPSSNNCRSFLMFTRYLAKTYRYCLNLQLMNLALKLKVFFVTRKPTSAFVSLAHQIK